MPSLIHVFRERVEGFIMKFTSIYVYKWAQVRFQIDRRFNKTKVPTKHRGVITLNH